MSRAQRLSEIFKKEIAYILQKQLNDDRIGFVSITDVIVDEDLSHAKVYFSCMGSEQEQKRSMRGLFSAKSFIRTALAKKIKLRYMPELKFLKDDSLERGSLIIEKINQLQKEREAREQALSGDQTATTID